MNVCTRCQNEFNSTEFIPKVLPCLHHFCVNCISVLYFQGCLICPVDKITYLLPLTEKIKTYTVEENSKGPIDCKIIKCNNNHALEQVNSKKVSKCSICNKSITIYMQCYLCKFEICEECIDWISNTDPNSSNIVCYNDHVLRVTQNVEEFYKQFKHYVKDKGRFLCDGCLIKKKGTSSQCRQCKVDYCQECTDKFEEICGAGEKIRCNSKIYNGVLDKLSRNFSICFNRLRWDSKKIRFYCRKCKKFFNKSGKFQCDMCSAEFCIGCTFNSLDRRSRTGG